MIAWGLTLSMVRVATWKIDWACSVKNLRYMKTRAANAEAATIKGTTNDEAEEAADVDIGSERAGLKLLVDVLRFSIRRAELEAAAEDEDEDASGTRVA